MYTQAEFLKDCLELSEILDKHFKNCQENGIHLLEMDSEIKTKLEQKFKYIYSAELDYKTFTDEVGESIVKLREYIKGYFNESQRGLECKEIIASNNCSRSERKQYELEINLCTDFSAQFLCFIFGRVEMVLKETNYKNQIQEKSRTRKSIFDIFKRKK